MSSDIIGHYYAKDIIHTFMEENVRSDEIGCITRMELYTIFEIYCKKNCKKRWSNKIFSLDYQELLKRMTKKYKAKYFRNGIPTKWIGVEIIYSHSDCEELEDIEL